MPSAHAAPSTDTMKSTRIERGVRRLRLLNQSTNQASMPRVGMRVMIWKTLQNMKLRPEMDMMADGGWLLSGDDREMDATRTGAGQVQPVAGKARL